MIFDTKKELREYNTLGLQAAAEAFVTVSSDAELLAALAWARARNLSVVALGEGSNVVLAGKLNALVLRQASLGIEALRESADSIDLRIAAGENWHDLVRWTLANGYFGLQNLALIPGTVGAAPIQNIGAYGVELQSVLLQVHARRVANDERITLDNAACQFAYRHSIFKRGLKDEVVITAIDLRLSRVPRVNISYPALASYFEEHAQADPSPQAVFDAVCSIRRSRLPDPRVQPNAGSFFKNPILDAQDADRLLEKYPALPVYPQADGDVKLSAAWMIDHCGWKGFRRNDVGVHPQHALVLVNYGSNSGAQLLSLAAEITASVYDTFAVELDIEPTIYGLRT